MPLPHPGHLSTGFQDVFQHLHHRPSHRCRHPGHALRGLEPAGGRDNARSRRDVDLRRGQRGPAVPAPRARRLIVRRVRQARGGAGEQPGGDGGVRGDAAAVPAQRCHLLPQ